MVGASALSAPTPASINMVGASALSAPTPASINMVGASVHRHQPRRVSTWWVPVLHRHQPPRVSTGLTPVLHRRRPRRVSTYLRRTVGELIDTGRALASTWSDRSHLKPLNVEKDSMFSLVNEKFDKAKFSGYYLWPYLFLLAELAELAYR